MADLNPFYIHYWVGSFDNDELVILHRLWQMRHRQHYAKKTDEQEFTSSDMNMNRRRLKKALDGLDV